MLGWIRLHSPGSSVREGLTVNLCIFAAHECFESVKILWLEGSNDQAIRFQSIGDMHITYALFLGTSLYKVSISINFSHHAGFAGFSTVMRMISSENRPLFNQDQEMQRFPSCCPLGLD